MDRTSGSVFLVATVVAMMAACGEPRGAELPGDQSAVGQPSTDTLASRSGPDAVLPAVPEGGLVVELVDRDGRPAGGARLEEVPEGVRVSLRVTGLSEGEHGLHFHEAGRCDPPAFTSAGAHFSPQARQHGFLNPQGPHAGDLPNIRGNAEGVADTTFVANMVRLTDTASDGLRRPGGTALMVHAGPDDYRTDPSGNSGDRIACGVISAS